MHRTKPYLKSGEKYNHSAKHSVEGFLGYLGFDPTLYGVFEIWDREAKPFVRGCEAVAIQGKKICVRVPSAAHRQELMYCKDRVIERINQALGRKAIVDILFEFE